MEALHVTTADAVNFAPLPPIHLAVASVHFETVFTWAVGIIFALVFLSAIYSVIRRGSWIPLMSVLGATGCVLLVAPLIPMSTVAVYWAAGWPMFLVLNMEPASWVLHVVALASVAQAVFLVWICSVALGYSGQVAKSHA